MNRVTPFIRVIVLAYDGAQMTIECIRSIVDSEWPTDSLEVVLIDNGSLDDIAQRVRAEFPTVRLLEPMRNLGFAGGCNFGIRAENSGDGEPLRPFDFVALVNNDATVAPNWLNELVEPFGRSSDVGAVSPKMLFHSRFSEVAVSGLIPDRSSTSDSSVRVTAVRIDGTRADDLLVFDEGFTPLGALTPPGDEIGRSTRLGGCLRVVRDGDDSAVPRVVSIRLESSASGRVRLRTDVDEVEVHTASPNDGECWVDVRIGQEIFDVVNNAGSELYANGSGGDRGFLERDSGQFEDPREVFAWCGGAVLLRKEYLDDVGVFDDSFFLYYEDTDLAWRGRLRGWKYMYAPRAVVRHRHAQSSVEGSDLFTFQVARNRLLVLVKNAPIRIAVKAVSGELQRFAHLFLDDVVRPVFRLSPPRLREIRLRTRILLSFAGLLPGAVRHRASVKNRVSRRKVFSWAVDKTIPVPEFRSPRSVSTVDSPADHAQPVGKPTKATERATVAIYNLFWVTLGGGEVVSSEIARAFSADHDVTLLGPAKPDPSEFRDRLGIDISTYAWREVSDDEEASRASSDYDVFVNCTYSSRTINRAPIGLYYVHFPRQLLPRSKKFALEKAIDLVQLAAKTPVKTSKFATAERLFRERLIDDSWVSSYTTFIANSDYTRRWIERIWHRDSEIVNPPVRARVIPGEKTHLISSVGRYFDPLHGHSKKQMELLTVFADMARSHLGVEDWKLSLVGGADSRSRDYVMRIRRAAQGLPIEVHVNAGRDVVDDTLARSAIYWHASGYDEDEQTHPDRLEHFGIAIVEAMAAGAVPLVFGAGGPAEIVRHGVDGFHWHTLEQLAQLTRRLMKDPELLRSMSESARVRAADFDPSVFERRMRGILEAVEGSVQTR